jgi:uncharacterized membrane protein
VGAASALFIAVFLACVVEAVEATTIVLAAGTARGWRSASFGTGAWPHSVRRCRRSRYAACG